jgi:glycosyltransferase involved in cell wall biosynthesis
MKLALVSTMNGAPWGGSEELWAAAAEQALARHIDVEAFLYRWPSVPSRVARLQAQGLRVFYRDRKLLPLYARARAKLVGAPIYLAAQLERSKPDLLCFSQSTTYELLGELDTCQLLQAGLVPYVLLCHHNFDVPLSDDRRQLARALFGGAALTVFIAEYHRQATERQIAGRLENAVRLQNPVNLPALDSVGWPPSGVAALACVGRLDAGTKGQDVLLEALSAPGWQKRDWRLSFYGQGGDEPYLRELVKSYGLSASVLFRGHVPDVQAIWAQNELLVLPSRTEGTSLSLVEALVCGRPALVTDVGDSARWVQEGVTGFVAERTTAASVSRALERAWLARPSWRQMGNCAHERVMAMIDPRPGETLLDALLELVDGTGAESSLEGKR